MHFDWRLWQMTQGFRWRIVLGVAIGLAAALIGMSRFVFLGTLIALVFQGAPAATLILPAAGVIAAVLLRGGLEHTRTMLAHRTAARIQEELRGRLYDKIAALGPAWFAGERTGGVMLSVVDGVEQLQTFFSQYLPQLCVAALTPLAIFAIIAWWDVPVAAVMLGAALFCLVLPMAFHKLDRSASRARQSSFRVFGAEFLDAIQGLATLKAFGQSASYGRMLAEKARALSNTTMWLSSTGLMTRGLVDICIAVGAAAAVTFGVWRVSHGLMSIAALLVVLMAGTEIFRPLRDLRTLLHQGLTGQAASVGITELLGTEPALAPAAAVAPASLVPTIEFADVRFAYPGGRGAALDNLSFTVAAGERVGIVGPSGAGKSSIARLLLRFYDPQAGAVRIGGQDLCGLDAESVRAKIAAVAQDTYLFHGTIEENLRLGKPNASQGELEAAARAANAHDFILSFPAGYQTLIGERGVRLSGGQRQRLAIARALLRDAPILILDEALSSVDAENEAVIQHALDRLMAGRTTLILAHRLSSVIDADRILVIEDGRVVESGKHAELMRHDGPYRRLMGAQARERDPLLQPHAEFVRDVREAAAAPGRTEEIDTEPADAILRADGIGWGKVLSGLLRVITPFLRRLSLVVTCGIGRVAAFIGVGVVSALAVAAVKLGHPYGGLLLLLAGVAPLAGLLHWTESWMAHDMAYRILAEMRIKLYAKLDALAPAFLLRRRSGDLVALATQDVETIEYFYAHTLAPAAVAILVPATVLVTLGAIVFPAAVALSPFLLYVGLAPILLRRRIDRLGEAAREGLGRLNAHVTDTIQGLPELVAFQAVARRRAGFMELTHTYHTVRLALLRDLSWQAAQLEMATGLGGLAVALTGALVAAHGGLNPVTLPLLTLIAVASFLPVSEIANVGRQLADTFASARRLEAVHAEPVTVVDGPKTPAPPARGSSIRFDGVSFTYPGRHRPALEKIDLEIPPGATLALVGPSGSGKTTAANLLLRFWDPSVGKITLDGVDLRDYALDHLRRRIALVAQDTYLFNDTLRGNVRLARPEASERDIAEAIERAALARFVETLPERLDTRVGERGVQLSGGQRQRVAIARAFLKNSPVLILDEATSHLDALSEAQVRGALGELMRDRTTIIIAHRLSTIRAADLIAVLDGGKLVEVGDHDTLVARGGLYASLVERQLGFGRAAE